MDLVQHGNEGRDDGPDPGRGRGRAESNGPDTGRIQFTGKDVSGGEGQAAQNGAEPGQEDDDGAAGGHDGGDQQDSAGRDQGDLVQDWDDEGIPLWTIMSMSLTHRKHKLSAQQVLQEGLRDGHGHHDEGREDKDPKDTPIEGRSVVNQTKVTHAEAVSRA